ncbi:MAG: SGNH/GDSL hydrolase family protein [Kiritimatiellia bacterium]|nr:SGNH/GDSL hydrolase family protein [Kiritimatiellia bacterium]
MNSIDPILPIFLLLLAAGVSVPAQEETPRPYANPERFEENIKRFEASDQNGFPPTGAIVCIGSSSMGGWHATLREDLAPLTVIPRGFGGSNMNDALHFADRIVIPYQPRAIVLYEGDNDIAGGIPPEQIRDTFSAFVKRVREKLPEVRIYVLSIKPSPNRWKLWPLMKIANQRLEAYCSNDDRLFYVDVATPMLDADGEPRPELYKEDRLHMTPAGYEVWRNVLRPILIENELRFEPRPADAVKPVP